MDAFALIILGGEIAEAALDVAAGASLVVCADSGGEHARRLGLPCHAIVGDLDSITPDTLRYFEARGTETVRIPDQEHNDFEKSLDYLAGKWNGEVRVLGMTGGRVDHTLSNFSVMLRHTERFEKLIAFGGAGSHFFLTSNRKTCSIACVVGTPVSLTPFGAALGVTTENLRYPLTRELLRLGEREGISNLTTGSPFSISIESGALLISIIRS